jgi:hypothetical protein
MNMSLIKRLSVACLCLSTLNLTQAASANTLAFTATGGNINAFEGDIPARSIGGVALPKGSVSVSGNTINVNAVPDWLFDKHNVLTGVILNPKLSTATTGSSTDTSTITGIAYFLKGEWLSNLGRNQSSEIVTLTNGTVLAGNIGGTSNTALDMVLVDGTHRSIDFSNVESITSPRAYPFKIPASSLKIEPSDGSYTAEVNSVSFTPAMFHSGLNLFATNKPQVPKSTLPGTEGGISNKYIATMIATDILVNTIAPAIAIPIVFTRSTLKDQQLLFINGNNSLAQPPFSPQVYANGTVHFFPQ